MIFIFCHIVLQGHLGKLRVMGLRFFGVRLLRSFARFQFDRLIGQPSVHKAILLFLFLRVKAIMKDHIIGGIFDRPLFFEGCSITPFSSTVTVIVSAFLVIGF